MCFSYDNCAPGGTIPPGLLTQSTTIFSLDNRAKRRYILADIQKEAHLMSTTSTTSTTCEHVQINLEKAR